MIFRAKSSEREEKASVLGYQALSLTQWVLRYHGIVLHMLNGPANSPFHAVITALMFKVAYYSFQKRKIREGTFFLGGGGGRAGEFWYFFPKKCWPSLAF